MPETLFEAPPYDPSRDRRRRQVAIGIGALLVFVAFLAFWFRNWPETRVVDRFFEALEAKDYERAYTIWTGDPDWKQHPEKYERYRFGQFQLDWGPGSPWGEIRTHEIEEAGTPRGGGSGVIVVVKVNGRVDPKARLWVEKSDKTLAFSPY
jgi:hypothetical protein